MSNQETANGKIVKQERFLANQTMAEWLYLIAWTIFLFGETLATTMFQVPGKFYLLCKVAPLLLVLVKVLFFDYYSINLFWTIVLAAAVGVGVAVASGYTEPVLWLVMLFGAKDVSLEKILRIYVLIVVSVVFLAFCASLLDVIENLQYERENSFRVRNSFGTVYTTDFASHVFSAFLVVFYLMRERLKVWHYLAAAVVAALVFWFCNTRLDVICIYLLIAVFSFLNIRERKKTIKKKYHVGFRMRVAACWVMPFAALVMFLASLMYRENALVFQKIDELISNRLSLGNVGLKRYGTSLLGQYVDMVGYGGTTHPLGEYFFIDCSYLYIFLRYGLIFFLIVMGVYVLCAKKFYGDAYFLAAIVLVSINCMISHHLVELTYNPFALAFLATAPEIPKSVPYTGRIGKSWYVFYEDKRNNGKVKQI